MTPETALLEHFVAALKAAPEVSALVGEAVFDEVPGDGAPENYLYIGPMNRRAGGAGDLPNECESEFWDITTRIFAATKDDYGRVNVWEIADAAARALHRTEPTLAGEFAIIGRLMVTQAGDVLEPQGDKSVFLDVLTTIQRG